MHLMICLREQIVAERARKEVRCSVNVFGPSLLLLILFLLSLTLLSYLLCLLCSSSALSNRLLLCR
jgi:hypothetical protein